MKILIIAVGHKQPEWVETATHEYLKRMPREAPVKLVEIAPEKRVSGRNAQQIMEAEMGRIRAALPSGCRVIALDERGANWTSQKLAQNLQSWQQDGRDVALIIGGADGLHPEFKQSAEQLLQLSALTMPHGMVRVLLAEQLYRAVSILNNHPYHRE